MNIFMNGLSLELQYRRESNYDGEKRTPKKREGRSEESGPLSLQTFREKCDQTRRTTTTQDRKEEEEEGG